MKLILNSAIALLLLINVTACNNTDKSAPTLDKTTERLIVKEKTIVNDIVEEEYDFDKIQNVKHGKSTVFYPSGKIMIEQNYNAGSLEGLQTYYFESGKVQSKINFEKGNKAGSFVYYYENGNIKQEGTYKNNGIEGILKGYYENGNLKEVTTFVDGWENGPFEEYNENGIIAVKGSYIPNPDPEALPLEQGILEEYDAEGKLKTKKDCNKGICPTIWDVVKGDIKPKTQNIPNN